MIFKALDHLIFWVAVGISSYASLSYFGEISVLSVAAAVGGGYILKIALSLVLMVCTALYLNDFDLKDTGRELREFWDSEPETEEYTTDAMVVDVSPEVVDLGNDRRAHVWLDVRPAGSSDILHLEFVRELDDDELEDGVFPNNSVVIPPGLLYRF
jgi:hypothetical protein